MLQGMYYSVGFKVKILVPTLIVTFLAFAMFTAYLVNDQKNKLNRDFIDKTDRFTLLLTNSNIGYIWRMDNESLVKNVKSFFDDKEITKILIKDEFDNELINLSRKIKGEHDVIKKTEFSKDNVTIGSLEVVYTDYYINETLSQILFKLIILALIVYVLVIILITIMSNLVIKPLQVIMEKVKVLSDGNLTDSILFIKDNAGDEASADNRHYDIRTRDEVGILAINFNNFVIKISDVIRGIKQMSDQLSFSSEQMKSTTQLFTDNAQNQAASVEEITATIEHVSAGMDSVAADVMQQLTNLNDLNKQIQDLSQIINQMGDSMQNTQTMTGDVSKIAKKGDESLKDMNTTISNIQKSSGEMINIINIINDISDKINLLSLNAAIEAARAGDAGRGFAVVADEISKLADMTASSTKEISVLIKVNDDEIKKGITNVNLTVENVSKIIKSVNTISEMIEVNYNATKKQLEASNTVTLMANRIKESAQGIKVSADQQKDATSEIVKSISTINDLIQANAAGAEEVTANSNEVNSAATELKEKIDFFKV